VRHPLTTPYPFGKEVYVTFVTFHVNATHEICSMSVSLKEHWEKVYQTKSPDQVSWTQKVPAISLALIRESGIPPSARIIDVGGGDSRLADHLVEAGYENVTVLDISGKALDKARQRLGASGRSVHWIESDVLSFVPDGTYSLWHDRASFHFLHSPDDIARYVRTVDASGSEYLIIGTFSEAGPSACSGLQVRQYDEQSLASVFEQAFEKVRCLKADHETPFGTRQNFLFCLFRRRHRDTSC